MLHILFSCHSICNNTWPYRICVCKIVYFFKIAIIVFVTGPVLRDFKIKRLPCHLPQPATAMAAITDIANEKRL
jgi:hypothetical protein